jgi:uncharacterized low-complexity protein
MTSSNNKTQKFSKLALFALTVLGLTIGIATVTAFTSPNASFEGEAAALTNVESLDFSDAPKCGAHKNSDANTKAGDKDGKCGEGKCGGDSAKAGDKDGKCGEGKCGGDSTKVGDKDGKCGEGKCGDGKDN